MASILHVCNWFDPSGDVTRSVEELRKHSAHTHEIVVKWPHPCKREMGFPESEGQCREAAYINPRFDAADAIIYHFAGWNHPLGYKRNTSSKPCAFRNANVLYNQQTGKFYCEQAFFANPNDTMYKLLASCHAGARDFMGEDTAFLPALMPINDELYTPDWKERAPCVGYLKHAPEITDELTKDLLIKRLNLSGNRFQSVLHMRRTEATITIDNLLEGHYGLAGTESLSQGIPSIAWNHPRTLKQLEDMAPGVGNPFLQARSVREAVAFARVYSNSRNEDGPAARNWIETYYNSKRLIERYWEPFCDALVRA